MVDLHGHTVPELRVLLVEDDEDFAALVAAQLGHPGWAVEIVLTHVLHMSDALTALGEGEFEVVLLDLGLPDEHGLRSVRLVVDHAGDAAVIVVTGHEEPLMAIQAVAVGAQEYVLKREITPPLLERTIRYAVERRALAAELEETRMVARTERELRRMERLSGAGPSTVTARLLGEGPLKVRSPQRWEEFAVEYMRIMERALEERTHDMERQVTADLRSLAGVIGFLGGTPRDVVTLHAHALSTLVAGAPPVRAAALAEEGRLLVLELMGHLASYYRARATVGADTNRRGEG